MSECRKPFFVLAALVAAGCAEFTSVPDELDPWGLGPLDPSLSVLPGLPPVCGEATVTRLIADETVPAGTVEVTQGGENLYVVYRTNPGWPILNTAVFVGSEEVVWEIPLASLSGPDLVIAAFAQVGETVG